MCGYIHASDRYGASSAVAGRSPSAVQWRGRASEEVLIEFDAFPLAEACRAVQSLLLKVAFPRLSAVHRATVHAMKSKQAFDGSKAKVPLPILRL